jgi:hypothetical protein
MGPSKVRKRQYEGMTKLIKVDLIVWIKIHAFGRSGVTSKIQVYLVIVTHARPRESTLLNIYTHFPPALP